MLYVRSMDVGTPRTYGKVDLVNMYENQGVWTATEYLMRVSKQHEVKVKSLHFLELCQPVCCVTLPDGLSGQSIFSIWVNCWVFSFPKWDPNDLCLQSRVRKACAQLKSCLKTHTSEVCQADFIPKPNQCLDNSCMQNSRSLCSAVNFSNIFEQTHTGWILTTNCILSKIKDCSFSGRCSYCWKLQKFLSP